MADPSLVKTPDRWSIPLRLLVIPFLVYLAWLLELFLFSGIMQLFGKPDLSAILPYTLVVCIITGMILPLILIRKAFVSGAVNMFQIGFRTLRRTLLACSGTGVLFFGIILFFNPFGADRMAFARAFLLVLPTAVATVMVCWVLVGTHIQAFVRGGGAAVSISAGIVVTAILFLAAMLAAGLPSPPGETLFWPVISGILAALFFFAVRDIYATVILVACSDVLLGAGTVDPGILQVNLPGIYESALLAIAVLVTIHLWLFRNYATILVPGRQ